MLHNLTYAQEIPLGYSGRDPGGDLPFSRYTDRFEMR